MIELSVVVPCYKKERIIVEDFTEKIKALASLGITFEIIAVIDGKIDNTEEKIRSLNDDRITVIAFEKNRGKGCAVREGIAQAKGKFISYLDADTDINPEILRTMYCKALETGADIVYPNKFRTDSISHRTFLRSIYSIFYISLLKLVMRLPVEDTQTGAKLYKRDVILHIMPYCKVAHICFEVEIFSIARKLGYAHFVDVPVETRHNDDSAMRLQDGIGFLFDTYKVYRNVNRMPELKPHEQLR